MVDCVTIYAGGKQPLKQQDAIQEKLYRETQGLTLEEKARQRAEWLATSDNPAARLWREMTARSKTCHVA